MHCLDICHSKCIIQIGTEGNTLRALLARKAILYFLAENKCLCSSSGQITFSFCILQLQTFDLAKEEIFLHFFLCKLIY